MPIRLMYVYHIAILTSHLGFLNLAPSAARRKTALSVFNPSQMCCFLASFFLLFDIRQLKNQLVFAESMDGLHIRREFRESQFMHVVPQAQGGTHYRAVLQQGWLDSGTLVVLSVCQR